ncbi:MAG: hypothetical protein HDP34_06115 [Clostridia bacterium]|nr:hypothetical protein [Clostridia bacterium]
MKAPFFKLEHSEESKALADLILSMETPAHYSRTRVTPVQYSCRRIGSRISYWTIPDSLARDVFLNTDKVFHLDELYIVYDGTGAPLCVSVSDKKARILYGGEYFEVTVKKVKRTQNPRTVYLAYLDMFPQSALNMSDYVPERKQYFLAPENTLYDSVTAVVSSIGEKTCLSLNAIQCGVGVWKLHKILFELDKASAVNTVYSSVGKTHSKYMTKAELCGSTSKEEILFALKKFPTAQKIVDGII